MKGCNEAAHEVTNLKVVVTEKKDKVKALKDEVEGLSSTAKVNYEMIQQFTFLREAVPLIKEKKGLMSQIEKAKEMVICLEHLKTEEEALAKECATLEDEKLRLEAYNLKAKEEVDFLRQLKAEYDSLTVEEKKKTIEVKTPSRLKIIKAEDTLMEMLLKMEARSKLTSESLIKMEAEASSEMKLTEELRAELGRDEEAVPSLEEVHLEDAPSLSLESLQESVRRVKGPSSMDGLTSDERVLMASIDNDNFRSTAATLYSYVPMGYKAIRYGFIKHLCGGTNEEVRLDFIEQMRGCPSISIDRITIEAGEILNMDAYKHLIALDVSKSNSSKVNKYACRLSKVASHFEIAGFSKTLCGEVPWLAICICSVMRQRGNIMGADEITRIADS
jgi:hypothetical protein